MPKRDRDDELRDLLRVAHQHCDPAIVPELSEFPFWQPPYEIKIITSKSGTGDPDANS
jgi:hypothetical protein